jgi:hypothetical protein
MLKEDRIMRPEGQGDKEGVRGGCELYEVTAVECGWGSFWD